ncbi:Alkaline phosphatase [Trichoderma simmonsii]|uniref:Alkaline phosphatase n=1 Tax=Trichoderma simmonsii TaxID=1491479 RepID=A0A8G0LII2_9HYPO|nr:Alkaline phosphatase [Trichoderma simmonsii]
MRGSLRLPNGLRAARASIRSTSILPPRLAAPTNTPSQASILRNHTFNPSYKSFHTSPSLSKNRDRDAIPDTSHRTSFSELDVLGSVPVPSTSVDVCMHDGFGLNSGITIAGGDGALLVNGEAFAWRPWEVSGKMKLVNEKGQFEVPAEAFGLFDVLWPRPDLLVIGVGKTNMPLSPRTRQHLTQLGMRVEMLDTRNAAAQFNLLATERGVSDVAAALIPIGWEEGSGVVS